MMKDHHKGNFDLMFTSLFFEHIFGWAYAELPGEDLWMSSTTNAHVVG